jgi:hypothetical protein
MRARVISLAGVAVLSVVGIVALAGGQGQDRPAVLPPAVPPSAPKPAEKPARDMSRLTPLQRQMDLSMQRGADWLYRHNRSDGRFVYGYEPALQVVLEGDHYPRQVGAAIALARAARYSGNERHLARARQAVLTLLLDTAPDADDPRLRHTTLPGMSANRLGTAGLLVLAINELSAPGDDLLEQSEQLCASIARQQQPDGSLNYADNPNQKTSAEDPDGVNHYPGPALHGLMRSQQHRPAAWNTEVVRKALAFYRPWWKGHPSMALVPWQVSAYTEAYLRTREQVFADGIFEMSDWICDLQYVQLDSRHPLWVGGFMSYENGKPNQTEPQISCAHYAEGLAEACRAARQAGDLQRYQRYGSAVKGCLQFLTTLQYTDANTTHFADWYRPRLLGGFHASHQDGTLRLDYTQQAVSVMVQYLAYGVE